MIVLTSKHHREVKKILHEIVPEAHVSVFGSRAKGTKKKFADLDLLIRDRRPLSLSTLSQLREAFSESDLPFRVDIVDGQSTSKEFLNTIQPSLVTFSS